MGPLLGVAYYPEHWPPSRWADDIRLMQEAGIEVVRLAEFAWAQLEPAPGRFDFSWLDNIIEQIVAAGMQVILCTPTAAPPAWMVERYPDMLPVDEQGRRRRFGSRRHVCPNHPAFLEEARRVTQALAERYGKHPAVVGWQLDNEVGGGRSARCYCPNCEAAFRRWLQARYGSLEQLNEAWGTAFWSQVYSHWEQIRAPILTVSLRNPSQVLDYYRFASDSWIAFLRAQAEVLRQVIPADRFITHNLMGLFHDIDYHRLAQHLDLVSWDNYPTGHAERWRALVYLPDEPPFPAAYDVGDPFITEMAHDLTRGLRQGPFWVMEQQCGHVNWGRYNPSPRVEALRLWCWQAIAHGADALVFFRWRAIPYGQELYHSGLLKHDGEPGDGFRVVHELSQHKALLEELQGAEVDAQVAMLFSYEDIWALEEQPHHADFLFWRHFGAYYRALRRTGVDVDIVGPQADLTRYRLVVAPTLHLVNPELVQRLTHFVEEGGHLVLGVRSGAKNAHNHMFQSPLPGLLAELIGARVEAWHSLPPEARYTVSVGEFGDFAARIWAEGLVRSDAEALATYTTGPLASLAALTRRSFGRGMVTYVGVWPDQQLLDLLVRLWLRDAGVLQLGVPDEGVTISSRQSEQGRLLFAFNWTEVPRQVTLYASGIDIFSNEELSGTVILPPLSVRVVRVKEN